MTPLVSIITLTTSVRSNLFLERICDIASGQDYPNFEHHIIHGDEANICQKRNAGCAAAKGDIIVFFDDDDYYASDYISESVRFLLNNGADVTGLSRAFFYQPHNAMWEWEWKGQPYVIESGMCFRKSAWENNKFPEDIEVGENMRFLPKAGYVLSHKYTEGMLAIIHHANTSSQNHLKRMKRLHPSYAVSILGDKYHLFNPIVVSR